MQQVEQLLNELEPIEAELQQEFIQISRVALINQAKMLEAFQAERIGTHHFQTTTGYGYNDSGREALERVFARVFHAEAALVRQQLVSGTHAIACAILGNLKPCDELILATGYPYETLLGVLGMSPENRECTSDTAGFRIKTLELNANGDIDIPTLQATISPRTKMVAFQRSCGYAPRRSMGISDLETAFRAIKETHPQVAIFVDNCYGEFIETREPLEVGADLIAGSLIKNPGGCLIPSGGYICGRADLVEKAAERLYAPKIAGEIGPSLINLQIFFQGFFEAPHRVSEMLKGAVLAAKLFGRAGYRVHPQPEEVRTDIIQKIYFDTAEELILFCQAVQKNSPIESHVLPEPALLPGYLHKVIMGGGTFISGSTSEFSADAPLRPPYMAFMQGGLSYTQIKLSLAGIIQKLSRKE
ncbi:MAG TPA: methionine gamma-lyase family protein [Bacillota bacterium]|nr:methionine gamma-lyase family protein [Bacillota bacterium]